MFKIEEFNEFDYYTVFILIHQYFKLYSMVDSFNLSLNFYFFSIALTNLKYSEESSMYDVK